MGSSFYLLKAPTAVAVEFSSEVQPLPRLGDIPAPFYRGRPRLIKLESLRDFLAFAQQQKLVVFLFVGASYFSDLPEPKWSKYFVQTHIVRVDYLSEAASMQLIEQPVPNFALRYAPGVAAQIYQLTQGHPHLLHSICSDLVDYANVKVKNPIRLEAS